MPAVIYPLATDVMLLDSYTSEPSHSAHCAANKRRSSVTFEDQVDQFPKGDPSIEQVTADIHNTLDSFASSLAKAIENDAKLQLFGEWTQIPTSLFTIRNTQRAPRYLDGQRLRMESIDEGIVKDDDDDEEEEHEEKIGNSSM